MQCNPEAGFKNFLEKPPAEKERLCKCKPKAQHRNNCVTFKKQ